MSLSPYRRQTLAMVQFRRIADECERRGRTDMARRATRAYKARMTAIQAEIDALPAYRF
jgi:hypothetical protein